MVEYSYYAYDDSWADELSNATALLRVALSDSRELYQGLDRRDPAEPFFLESNYLFTRYFYGDDEAGTFKITLEEAQGLLDRWEIKVPLVSIPTSILGAVGGNREDDTTQPRKDAAMDQDDERYAEQVARAMELGAILEDLGLAADGGYERLLVDQCVLYGNSDDDLDRLDTLNVLYEAHIRLAMPAQRLETLGLLCGLIEQGETSSGALISFVYVEEDLEVLSSAARELVRLYEADGDDDDLGGARFVRQLIDEAEDDLQRVGLVRGLLLTGDLRIESLVGGVWRLLGFGNQQRLADSLGGAANPLTAAFLTEWLRSAEGAERGFVQAALSEVTQVLEREEA